MLFHIFCRNSGGIIKSQWVIPPPPPRQFTAFSWELPMPTNAEQSICPFLTALLLPWWADSPSLWPALALVLPVFCPKWSCTRSKVPKVSSCHLFCFHIFLCLTGFSMSMFFMHWRCSDGIWCSKSVFKNAKNRNNLSLGFFFFFFSTLASTSQTISGLYLHIINNCVSLGMKQAYNIHSYNIIQTG